MQETINRPQVGQKVERDSFGNKVSFQKPDISDTVEKLDEKAAEMSEEDKALEDIFQKLQGMGGSCGCFSSR